MMGIERLDYFLSAVRWGSFTRAAQECGVVPSTISQQIASLEKEVGFSLFARKGRGVVLTRQGELFYQKAQGLQTEYRTAVRQTQMAKRLQVGVNSMHNLQALQQLFLQQEHDGLEVCIEQYGARKAREKLRSGECDLFWGYASPAWEGFMQKTLAPQPVYVWGADLPEGPVGLEQLLQQDKQLYFSWELWEYLQTVCPEIAQKQKEEKLRLLDNPDMVLPTARANRQIALTSALDNQESRLLVSEKTGEPLQIWQAAFWRKEEPKEILRKFFERIEEDL